MSTIKADGIEAATGTNTDLTLAGKGTGVPDIAAGFKVGGTAGVPINNLRVGTDGELITWDASGDPAAVAVGTATHVLTSNGAGAAPTFQAAAGGAYTSISNTDITATTNIDITGFDPTAYDNYEIWLSNGQNDTTGRSLRLLFSTDGGSSYDTSSTYNQNCAGRRRYDANNVWTTIGEETTEIKIPNDSAMGAVVSDEPLSIKFQLYRPDDAVDTIMTYQGSYWNGDGSSMVVGDARHIVAENTDAIRFHWSVGDWNAAGSIQLLGCTQ